MQRLEKISKKNKDYILLFTNPLKEIRTKEEVIIKYGFIHKMDVEDDIFESFLNDVSYYDFYYLGLSYLKISRSQNEVLDYLTKNGCSYKMAIDITKKYISMHLINDLELANFLVCHLIKNHKGPNEIIEALKRREIPISIIQKSLDNYSLDAQYENVFYLLQHSFSSLSKKPRIKGIRDFYEKCEKKGFMHKIVKKVIEENEEILDNIIDEDELIERDFMKAKKHYEKKYNGLKLNQKIISNLLSKGYCYEKIKKILE